ncbi:aspartyl protease family protein [uncultured Bacteroides sp.]|uniref:aspartyl protease family protein n=1 Tax=uncultured Bacteroides sp. TaxID=162156 RepID=UPI00261283B8|nr:aspartyl protease family protein [uncultured Bacteroides sp.]
MKRVKSKSEKRLIIEGLVNGKSANFLIDTGASIALISESHRKKFDLKRSRIYNGTIIGAGGDIGTCYVCDTFPIINGKPFPQFILADIDNIINSIKRETGIEILGIISLPQMRMNGIQIDANDNEIIFE